MALTIDPDNHQALDNKHKLQLFNASAAMVKDDDTYNDPTLNDDDERLIQGSLVNIEIR